MYLDISSNQGLIDWKKVSENKEIDGVILRATTKNNALDVRTMENYNGILQNVSAQINELSVYKFSYAKDYQSARIESTKCLCVLATYGIKFDRFYLDIEANPTDYKTDESSAIILAYMDTLAQFGVDDKFALYFNYNYLKNIIDPMFRRFPIWLARYNKEMGDTFGANVVLWQYTSKGKVNGINGDVDLSKVVTT